jgi:hypothetical protein
MEIQVRIVLDSGCFVRPNPQLGYPNFRVGYFQSHSSVPDVRIYADGEELDIYPHLKLGDGNSVIDVWLRRPNGSPKGGVTSSSTLNKYLLDLRSLYPGEAVSVDERNFDCILQFHAGHFRCSKEKRRYFKEILRDGTPGLLRKETGPIAHDVVVTYSLTDGDELSLITNGQTLWSTESLKGVSQNVDIEILAEDDTALKYYMGVLPPRASYWVCNQGNPPPSSLGGTRGGTGPPLGGRRGGTSPPPGRKQGGTDPSPGGQGDGTKQPDTGKAGNAKGKSVG